MFKLKTFQWIRLFGQFLLYGVFAIFIGVFSQWPSYQVLTPNQAIIKLSFSHHGKPISDCEKSTNSQLAKLPPNMRAPIRCPRERSPVNIELSVDGIVAYQHAALPAGLSRDGASAVYHRMAVNAGPHRILVRLNDDVRKPDLYQSRDEVVTLEPGQILVIDFDSTKGGVTFQ